MNMEPVNVHKTPLQIFFCELAFIHVSGVVWLPSKDENILGYII